MKAHSQQISLSRRTILGTLSALFVAPADAAVSNLALPAFAVAVNDTIRGATEDIAFSGAVPISVKLVDDPDLRAPRVLELIIDFSAIRGIGKTTGTTYLSLAQSVLHRPLQLTDQIRTSFPYYADNNMLNARTALASFFVSYASSRISITSKLTTPA